ncbi:cytochrome P450 [Scytonema sp. UIC 10036]|uniref:cytochrome P450 n=1 Tax=Scytonema sp. UIC 10036 TaxID=2304196 RepID=UPI0012DAE937|nr:cytochrome P450 [Scytonema sp. UIC 10036]MUG94297.1 cytochrome P450 [Scytonema sp. UIC 10036]
MQLPNLLKTPSFVQTFQWLNEPTGFLEKVALVYPDIFSSHLTGYPSVYVQHPHAIQEIFTNDRKKFVLRQNKFLEPVLGEYSIATLVGEQHKRQRQLLMPPFHGDKICSYAQPILNLTEKIFTQLPRLQPFRARVITQDITLQVILQAVFGLYEGEERYQKLKHALVLMFEPLGSLVYSSFLFIPFLQKDLGAWSPWGRFVRLRKQVDELIYTEIAERRAQPNPERMDVLSLLMEAKDESGKLMSDIELRDELMTLLFAGHETTATAIAWGLYWTHRVPEVGEKLCQEINSLGDDPQPISISQLPYLTAVCKETLRIYPPALFAGPRMVKEPANLAGHQLEPGTTVTPCIYLTHHRDDLYENPKRFQPERFLDRQYSTYEFLPFGGGVRRCIGEALAWLEMKLVLATILSRYQLALVDAQPEQARSRGLTLVPANGVKMVVTGRRMR